ncbi:MAG TPA: DUF4337 domain-containing protein [Thermoanaerobaculia bacterium]|jgi:hypothetical protein|nr:DUF4337 domain-containing protein [Thermoanaerobaculia bacterium]
MPEGPEIETEKLHETIHEELEHEGGTFLKRIALTTALFAAVAAIAALKAGATVNEALVLKTEATRLQAEASDQWAYYQAKGIKGATAEAARTSWLAIAKEPPAEYSEKQKRYAEEQKEIEKKARELEKKRDEKSAEADHLLHRHHGFANAVALFQVSIALGAVAALTRSHPVWWGSMLLGGAATLLFVLTLVG